MGDDIDAAGPPGSKVYVDMVGDLFRAGHVASQNAVAIATGVQVYFCDPKSP